MKKIMALLLSGIMTFSLIGCTSEEKPQEEDTNTPIVDDTADETEQPKEMMDIAFLKGPTGLSAANLMESNEMDETLNEYNVTLASAPDEISTKLIQGELEAAAVPVNLAATLYNKTEGNIKLLAVNSLGVLYIVDSTGEIEEISDLSGKTIYATGQGATPQFVIEHVLAENGLTDSVTVEYKTEHAELAALVAAGEVEIALLPEPFVTSALNQNENLEIAIDVQEEWETITEVPLSMGVIAVNADFAENNPQAVENFVDDLNNSVKLSDENVEITATASEKFDIMPSAVVTSALERCNIVLITNEDAKNSVTPFLEILFEINPNSIGGAIPNEDFFYTITE